MKELECEAQEDQDYHSRCMKEQAEYHAQNTKELEHQEQEYRDYHAWRMKKLEL